METLHLYFFVCLLILLSLRKYAQWRDTIRSIQDYPGLRCIFGAETAIIWFRIPYISVGIFSGWKTKHQDFAQYGSDIISAQVSILPRPHVAFFLADAQAIKDVTNARHRFTKPVENMGVLSFYGENVVVTEHDEWKRHRKVTAPAFTERNMRLVWDVTTKSFEELCEVVWNGLNEIAVDNIADITVNMMILVIGNAAFGQEMSWVDRNTLPAGHAIKLKDAMSVVARDILMKAIFPEWVLTHVPISRVRRFYTASNELKLYMEEMIQSRRSGESLGGNDLITCLLKANDDGVSKGAAHLSDSEVMGNIFAFLVAGAIPNFTTAHSLAFALILLALHQDEQRALYQHIKSVLPDGRVPSYDDMSQLTYSLAVFLESLRMFAPVSMIPKQAEEDSVLTMQTPDGELRTVFCPAGSRVMIHVAGLHYNPRYWPDPYAFKPARFLDKEWPRDALLAFSTGPRGCIGRRFAETEAVAAITYLVSRFRIEIKDEPQYKGESEAERRERLLKGKISLTFGPAQAPLVFKRRTGCD
ncbi:cytochrome P450 [Wolfiporia cocos MD-104 SS10]|uniref:Cytochrome P450 n=1 Tax=Wolfiporia cocos (strain MD-104) TaxID=742152 RepID=A0A2H3JGN3_WOLCO|nr:cytochrome P450 [Wolfiporia cocos MD-104 SS10]